MVTAGGHAGRAAMCKTVGRFLAQLNIHLPYSPTSTLLGIYPKELKIYVHRYVYNSFIHNCQNMEATKTSFSR